MILEDQENGVFIQQGAPLNPVTLDGPFKDEFNNTGLHGSDFDNREGHLFLYGSRDWDRERIGQVLQNLKPALKTAEEAAVSRRKQLSLSVFFLQKAAWRSVLYAVQAVNCARDTRTMP